MHKFSASLWVYVGVLEFYRAYSIEMYTGRSLVVVENQYLTLLQL